MTDENKRLIAREFLFDLIQLANEMETAADNTLGELSQKQTLMVLIDVVKHSLLTLKAHADQWHISDKALEVILGSVVNISDKIADMTEKNDKLDAINLPAVELSLRIHSCYSGPIY